MEIVMLNRLLLVSSTLAAGLLLMASPVHAEQDNGSILAADSPQENTRRNVRDKDEATLTKDDQNGGKKNLKSTTNIHKTLATDESLSLSPPQNLRIITDPR
jgi:hyperosmotically inducible periplasmic protein